MKLSTSGPVLSVETVQIKDSGDLCGLAVVEALNLAASHLQTRVTEDQAAFATLAFLASCMDWVAAESGKHPRDCASMALSLLLATGPRANQIPWQKPGPKILTPDG